MLRPEIILKGFINNAKGAESSKVIPPGQPSFFVRFVEVREGGSRMIGKDSNLEIKHFGFAEVGR